MIESPHVPSLQIIGERKAAAEQVVALADALGVGHDDDDTDDDEVAGDPSSKIDGGDALDVEGVTKKMEDGFKRLTLFSKEESRVHLRYWKLAGAWIQDRDRYIKTEMNLRLAVSLIESSWSLSSWRGVRNLPRSVWSPT